MKNLVCVSKCSERGVALTQMSNTTSTKEESQKQNLLQVTEGKDTEESSTKCNHDSVIEVCQKAGPANDVFWLADYTV